MQSVDGKKTRVWVGIKLQEDKAHTRHVSNGSLTLKKSSKSVKSKKENDKMRVLRADKKLDEMFKK